MKNKNQQEIEWQKIKDYDVCSYEELCKMFEKHPEGRCFRKYTHLPWSKDNFFFGTYDELQNYYKTTNEIPFYILEKVNTKIGKLSIKSFSYNDKHEVVANCECDCGNKVSYVWKKMQDNEIKSCGCARRNKKDEKSDSITSIYPQIIKENWDYDKNKEDPKQISINSKESYWWKGYNQSYLMPISDLKANVSGTSFPEQAILYFLSNAGLKCESRHKIEMHGKKYEVDIFLPDYGIAVEYDGVVWHKQKSELEREKNAALNEKNIFLIRVREYGLEPTGIINGLEICNNKNISDYNFIGQAITKIMELIGSKDKEFNPLVITSKNIAEARKIILSRYMCGFNESNINKSWLINFWCAENEIPSYQVDSNSTDKFWFKCHTSKIFISPFALNENLKSINNIEEEKKYKDSLLIDNKCPFRDRACCPRNKYYFSEDYLDKCDFYADYNARLNDTINKIINFDSKQGTEKFQEYLSRITEVKQHISDIIWKYINNPNTNPKDAFKNIYNAFRYPFLNGYNEICLAYKNPNVLSFYFENYDYENLEHQEWPFLNLNHSENIYGNCYSMIYRKEFAMLSTVLEIVSTKLSKKAYDIFIKNLFLQFYTRKTNDYENVMGHADHKEILLNILCSNVSTETKNYIQSLIDSDRNATCVDFLLDYAFKLDCSDKFNETMYKTIESRVRGFEMTKEQQSKLRELGSKYDKYLMAVARMDKEREEEKKKRKEQAKLEKQKEKSLMSAFEGLTENEKINKLLELTKNHYSKDRKLKLINSKTCNIIIDNPQQNKWFGFNLYNAFSKTVDINKIIEETKVNLVNDNCELCFIVVPKASQSILVKYMKTSTPILELEMFLRSWLKVNESNGQAAFDKFEDEKITLRDVDIDQIFEFNPNQPYEYEICTAPFKSLKNEKDLIATLTDLIVQECKKWNMTIIKAVHEKFHDFNVIAEYPDKSGIVGYLLTFSFYNDKGLDEIKDIAKYLMDKNNCSRCKVIVPKLTRDERFDTFSVKLSIDDLPYFLQTKIFKPEIEVKRLEYYYLKNVESTFEQIKRCYRGLETDITLIPQSEWCGIDIMISTKNGKFGLQLKHQFNDKRSHPEKDAVAEAELAIKKYNCDKCFIVLQNVDNNKILEKYAESPTPIINHTDPFVSLIRTRKI